LLDGFHVTVMTAFLNSEDGPIHLYVWGFEIKFHISHHIPLSQLRSYHNSRFAETNLHSQCRWDNSCITRFIYADCRHNSLRNFSFDYESSRFHVINKLLFFFSAAAIINLVKLSRKLKQMRKGEKRKQAYRMSSKISGLVRSRCFILSFMAVMMICVLSSAPCLELFSAAPLREIQAIFKRNWKINNRHTHTDTHTREFMSSALRRICQWLAPSPTRYTRMKQVKKNK
jgi:hypothetical protein